MSHNYRKPLITGVIATLFAIPAWAVPDHQPASSTQAQHKAGQAMHGQQTPFGSTVPLPGIYRETPKELRSKKVLGSSGRPVGTLEDIVAERDGRKLCAVLSLDGILGIGGREVVVPLELLQPEADGLHVLVLMDDLDSRKAYTAKLFREVQPPDRPISEFLVAETGPQRSAH